MSNTLLSTRNKRKSKKPEFERTDVNIFKQFKGKWRKPKGIHNKLRRGFRGHKQIPSIGFSSPNAVKGLTRSGFIPVNVANVNDLQNIKTDCVAIINHSVGMKKRVQILTKAKELKIKVLGVKDIDAFLTKISESRNVKKKQVEIKKEQKKKKIDEVVKVEEKKDEPKK